MITFKLYFLNKIIMQIIEYLSKEEIISLYYKIHTYNAWQYRAEPLLKLCLNLEEIGQGNTREDKLKSLLVFDNLFELYKFKNLKPDLQIIVDKYMDNLPGFKKENSKQDDTTLEMHGYCYMIIFRYIENICSTNSEFVIFDKSWINTKEKFNVVNQFFNEYINNNNSDNSINILNNFKLKEITNFNILRLFLKLQKNDKFLHLIYNIWCLNKGNYNEQKQKFKQLEKTIEKLEIKDSLYSNLLENSNGKYKTTKL